LSLLEELMSRPVGPSMNRDDGHNETAPRLPQQGRGDYLKILLLDIETYPALTWQWSLWDKFTPVDRLVRPGGLLCWAAKWYGESEVKFASLWGDGVVAMAERMWDLLDEADAVVTYNGDKFDLPKLRSAVELESGIGPVSPFKSIDLYKTIKQFDFLSRKLDFVCKSLEIGEKIKHSGFDLWPASMPVELGGRNDADAQELMRAYNVGDVANTLEPLYDAVLPWIKGHPHVGLYADDGTDRCHRCGSPEMDEKGRAHTPLGVFTRYQCKWCKSWLRGKKSILMADTRAV
jgi:hypothetical protein